MACRGSLKSGTRMVKPVLSLNHCEARLRVLGLYRHFYRYIPHLLRYFDIEKNFNDVRTKIRENFYKNAHIEDVRVIDILVIKGYMELDEIRQQWQQKGHIFSNWNPTLESKPVDFLSKFIDGRE